MKIEQLLDIASDSQRMGGWNDALSMTVDSVCKKMKRAPLSDEELQFVAGGVTIDQKSKLKTNILGGDK